MADLQKATRRVCQECRRPFPKAKKPLPKFTRRVPIKLIVDGVMTWPDGHQKDMTRAARDVRRERIWKRDDQQCQQTITTWPFIAKGEFGGHICGRLLTLCQAHIHHIRKRSVGRDDRDQNQVTLCADHHRIYSPKLQFGRRK